MWSAVYVRPNCENAVPGGGATAVVDTHTLPVISVPESRTTAPIIHPPFLSSPLLSSQRIDRRNPQAFLIWDGPPILGGISLCDLIMFLLATPVQFVVGRRFYRAAWLGAKHGSLGMDALVVMGTSSAYAFSVCVLLVKCSVDPMFPSKCTFETAAMLLTLVSLGKLMEAIAKGQTSSSLTALVKLQPRTALLLPPAPAPAAGSAVVHGNGSVNGGAAKEKKKRRARKSGTEAEEIDAGLVQVGFRHGVMA